MLEETRSDLEAQVEKLERQLKQLEVLPSDIEKLTMVHTFMCPVLVCVCVLVFVHECMCACVYMCACL